MHSRRASFLRIFQHHCRMLRCRHHLNFECSDVVCRRATVLDDRDSNEFNEFHWSNRTEFIFMSVNLTRNDSSKSCVFSFAHRVKFKRWHWKSEQKKVFRVVFFYRWIVVNGPHLFLVTFWNTDSKPKSRHLCIHLPVKPGKYRRPHF